MEKQIKDYTDTELKAVAYDVLSQIEVSKQTLAAINQELAGRKTPVEKKGEVKK